MEKFWANSGDSHFLEPPDLWQQILPAGQAARMPWAEKVSDHEEVVHVDGQSFRRDLPKVVTRKGADGLTIAELSSRPPGARDIRARLQDLDEEGIWAEVVYASLGLWSGMLRDRALIREAAAAQNVWLKAEVQDVAPDRLVPVAMMPLLDVDDAVAEIHHVADLGLHAVGFPTGTPVGMEDWNRESWEPVWAAAAETGTVVTFHIGTDGEDPAIFRGPGAAVFNYLYTTYGGQFVAAKLVSAGVFDRHPSLKVLISEGGATWVPFVGDRMNEGYRQHGMFVRPKLSRLPKEYLYENVYASFQHDESGPAACWAMGYRNVLWGSDYPHLEGTFGHTQKTLHELFDDVEPDVRERITRGAFKELFPHVSDPPA